MSEPKFHISRGELELGAFSQSEIGDLLAADFLLPTDMFRSEGQVARQPLSKLVQGWKPARTSMTAQVSRSLAAAARSARTGAVWASTKASAVAIRNKQSIGNSTNRLLEDYLPRLRGFVAAALARTIHSAETAFHDEVILRKLFGAVHDLLPKPVRRFVGEEVFVEFCLRHKQRLLGKGD